MSVFLTFISILFITAVGSAVIKAGDFLPKRSILFLLSLGYGLGIGLVYVQLFLYSQIGIAWTRESIIIPWILFFVALLFLKRKKLRFSKFKKLKLDFIEKVVFGGILLAVSYTLFEALLRPLSTWDGWASWLFKSKVFFLNGNITPEALLYVGAEYPLVISLFGTFIYIVLGFVNDTAVLLTSFAFYIFLSLAFFSVVKKDYGMKYALISTFLLVTIQNLVRHGGRIESGQADLPLGYFIFISTMLLVEYYKTNSAKVLMLLSLFLGITALIKVEGLPFTVIVVILILYNIYIKKIYSHLWALLFWLLPILEWNIYKQIYNLSYMGTHDFWFSFESFFSVFSDIIKRIIQELVNIKTWNMLWITYFLLLVFWPKKLGRTLLLINIVVLSQFGLYIMIYLFLTGFHPESSIERLLVHIAPLALYVVVVRVKQMIFS